MGFIANALMKGTANTASAVFGNAYKRTLVGTLVGGVGNVMASDNQDPTNLLMDFGKGAVIGGAIGGGSRLFTPGVVGGKLKGPVLSKGILKGVQGVANISVGVGKTAWGVGKFALAHPYLTIGTVAAGSALNSMNSSPYLSPTKERGVQSRNYYMQQSTYGLVQGMHSNRH